MVVAKGGTHLHPSSSFSVLCQRHLLSFLFVAVPEQSWGSGVAVEGGGTYDVVLDMKKEEGRSKHLSGFSILLMDITIM